MFGWVGIYRIAVLLPLNNRSIVVYFARALRVLGKHNWYFRYGNWYFIPKTSY